METNFNLCFMQKYYRKQLHGRRTNFHRVDSDEGHDSDESRHWVRGKRSLVGGHTQQDPENPEIKSLAQFALQSIDELSNDLRRRKVVSITEATSQVNIYLIFVSKK